MTLRKKASRGISRRMVTVGLAMTAFGVRRSAGQSAPIKIGSILSLTGPLSIISIAQIKGVELAIDEINSAGGVLGRKFELVNRDSGSEPVRAVNAAKELIFSEKVNVVIGPGNSAEGLAATPVMASGNMPNIVLAQVDEVTDPKKYPYAFRAANTNTQQISVLNDYALKLIAKDSSKGKLALIGDTGAYGMVTAKQAEEKLLASGIKPVFRANISVAKTDMTDDLTKAKDAGANMIIAWIGGGSPFARLLNARGNLKWDVPVLGHPLIMWPENRNLLDKREYWDNAFGPGFRSTTFDNNGNLPEPTKQLLEKMRPRLGGGEVKSVLLVGRARIRQYLYCCRSYETRWFNRAGFDQTIAREHS